MKQLRLIRVTEYAHATMGVLTLDNIPVFVTLEDVWRDNEKMVSCIPVGKYRVKAHKSPRFGSTYQVMNVPDRDFILFHYGNTSKDTNGCILLGMQYGKISNDPAILASRSAFLQFMDLMQGVPEAQLEVIDACGANRIQ